MLGVVGGFAVVIGSVVLLGTAFHIALVEAFQGVDPSVAAAIVAAVATGVLSVGTLVMQRRHERREALEREIRAKKVDVYIRLVNSWFDIFGLGEDRSDDEDKAAQGRAISTMAKLTPELITWASDPVIKAWAIWRRGFIGHEPDPRLMMLGFEQVLFTIRKDLGHANKDLLVGDVLALWINDVHVILDGPGD